LASTVDNLNKTTTRINTMLDEIEEPLRRIMPQVGTAMNTMASMGEVAAQLGDLTKRLGPLTTLAENAGGLFGFKPSKPTPPSTSSSQQTE
jgi:ABC-type transporter Mla subunit MlaD